MDEERDDRERVIRLCGRRWGPLPLRGGYSGNGMRLRDGGARLALKRAGVGSTSRRAFCRGGGGGSGQLSGPALMDDVAGGRRRALAVFSEGARCRGLANLDPGC